MFEGLKRLRGDFWWTRECAGVQRFLEDRKHFQLTSEQIAFWKQNGYLVLPRYFSDSQVDLINQLVDQLWITSAEIKAPLVIDAWIGTDHEKRMHFRDASPQMRNQPYKLNDLYLESEDVRDLVLEDRLSVVLTQLLGSSPLVCNTLSLEYGSQQDFHTDSLYMTPPKDLNMVASWIALEDCRPEAGPLRYYPESHLIPPFRFTTGRLTLHPGEEGAYRQYMEAQVAERKLKSESFCAKKGDVFIWHSQLYHSGAPILKPGLTRRSLVTHYFRAKDVPGPHPGVGTNRYYLKRAHQTV